MRNKNDCIRLLLTATCLLWAVSAHAQQENMDTLFDLPHVIAYIVAGLMISIFVLVFYNRLIIYREQDAKLKSHTQNTQLAMVMRSCKLRVWIFDVQQRQYSLLSDEGDIENTYTPLDFSQFFDRDDFEAMRKEIFAIRDEQSTKATIRIKASARKNSDKQRLYEVNLRTFEFDDDGHPASIIGLQRDITDTVEQQDNVNKLLLRFQTVFNSSVIDMLYYDKDGYIVDVNDKACTTFGIKDRQKLLDRRVNITDIVSFRDIDIKTFAGYRLSTITDIASLRKRGEGRIPDVTVNSKMYYDIVINPIRNEQGELTGLYTAGRDISEMVGTFHRQKESSRQLERATKDIKDYINNINYALQTSEVRLMNYNPETHLLEISNDLNRTQYQLTQLRCVELVNEKYRRRAKGVLRKMDRRENSRVDMTLCSVLRDKQGRNIWFTFNIIPMLKADGTVSHYFGMCRNTTETVATQKLLEEETAKAQETEQLKDAFLLNMSYEIRTPLNTVLGFAEMYNQEHDVADEPLFAEEIKRNANELLALVNETLFLSRLDAHMIEMHKSESDFAVIFDSYCHMGWSNIAQGVKAIVENPYEHLLVTIDEQNLGQVIQRLCNNAAYYTTEGYVRAKYEYRQGMLTIVIEDSGSGIDSQTLPHVFDRFVTDVQGYHCGTGLNLPIIKELTEQMGGTIEFQSEFGKGTTVWVSIPCEATNVEKKKEILNI